MLATHHIVPVELGGKDTLANLVVLCANCHRTVHWLGASDRSLNPNAYGLGQTPAARKRLLALARRIRARRLREIGPDRRLVHSVSLETALTAVITRNGYDSSEAELLRRCFKRAWSAVEAGDRRACSLRLPRGQRFLSLIANSHLAIRVPGWADDGYRDGDIMLIWPQARRPSILSPRQFRKASTGRFRLIPHFNLCLTWDECLSLSPEDWRVFGTAVHDGLTLVRSQRRSSNVSPEFSASGRSANR